LNKKNLLALAGALVIGASVGIVYEKFLASVLREKLESISFDLKPEPIGYQGVAKIEAVQAYLFYDHTGGISGNLLTKKHLVLWNTVIGEGDAGEGSNSTLVVVEVSGEGSSAKVNVVITDEDQKTIINETRKFWIFDSDRKFYMPFIVPNTGCKEITITAKLVGKGFSPSSISQTIPFKCGE
jgi:hypothetical protein